MATELVGVLEAPNAGHRLWAAQKQGGTGLCVGLDPQYEPDLYSHFSDPLTGLWEGFHDLVMATEKMFNHRFHSGVGTTANYLTGLTEYFYQVVDAAWENGIRVFKPQAAFYERNFSYGLVILALICERLDELATHSGEPVFKILDAKRGDIETTQDPYYQSYLAFLSDEVIPGMTGRYGFDTMTVTTWMGEDVLTPGLPLFKRGKGAIVVTRSSNPSGTTLQDMYVDTNADVTLSDNQSEFQLTAPDWHHLCDKLGRCPTAHEVMLYETELFCEEHELKQDGVDPIFSVMGSTVEMEDSFRIIRGQGSIALIPGFGAQGGKFKNVMPLVVKEGPLTGLLGILASSRNDNYPWMTKFGGKGDPKQLKGEMARSIDTFRAVERKEGYDAHGVDYPF